MSILRTTYEQQLISLKQEAKDPTTKVRSLSNIELLLAINYYLHYFNCETWSTEELLTLELRLNYDAGALQT